MSISYRPHLFLLSFQHPTSYSLNLLTQPLPNSKIIDASRTMSSTAELLTFFPPDMRLYYEVFGQTYTPFLERCVDDGLTFWEVIIVFQAIRARMETPLPHFNRFVFLLLGEFGYPGAPPLLGGH
ncbi:hypothetical protein MMC26_006863 [Xylographa opegraphella]|nr:hypothetical protein [Xylographa opegraphella]